MAPKPAAAKFTPEEDAYIVQLKGTGQYSWKEIAEKFNARFGASRTPGALQVRFSRSLNPAAADKPATSKGKSQSVPRAPSVKPESGPAPVKPEPRRKIPRGQSTQPKDQSQAKSQAELRSERATARRRARAVARSRTASPKPVDPAAAAPLAPLPSPLLQHPLLPLALAPPSPVAPSDSRHVPSVGQGVDNGTPPRSRPLHSFTAAPHSRPSPSPRLPSLFRAEQQEPEMVDIGFGVAIPRYPPPPSTAFSTEPLDPAVAAARALHPVPAYMPPPIIEGDSDEDTGYIGPVEPPVLNRHAVTPRQAFASPPPVQQTQPRAESPARPRTTPSRTTHSTKRRLDDDDAAAADSQQPAAKQARTDRGSRREDTRVLNHHRDAAVTKREDVPHPLWRDPGQDRVIERVYRGSSLRLRARRGEDPTLPVPAARHAPPARTLSVEERVAPYQRAAQLIHLDAAGQVQQGHAWGEGRPDLLSDKMKE